MRLRDRRTTRLVAVLAVVGVVAGAGIVYASLSICGCSKQAPPDIDTSTTFHAGNETLVVTHEGGTAFDENDTDAVEVYVTPAGSSFSRSERRPVRRLDLPFIAGYTVAVADVDWGETVRLVWVAPDGTSRVLARHRASTRR